MAASNPNGEMQFWFNGLPFRGISNTNDSGEMQFWFNGLPNGYVFPPSGPPPTSAIKTIFGVAIAQVKTVNGVAVASMKTFNGLA